MSNVEISTELTARSDAELILGARSGDDSSYGELYQRHVAAARAAARNLVRDRSQADDLVSEGFTRVLSAIRRGGGPEIAFRPYLLTSVRNAHYDRARTPEGRLLPVELGPEVTDDFRIALADPLIGPEDRALIASAFASLPERWQLVLWHTEVEGQPASEVAPLLGLAPNAVAALSYRAREGLREAYLQAHLQHEPPPACREARGKLGAYVRQGLSDRDRTMVDQHLDTCEGCRGLLVELRDVSTALRSVVAPAILGAPLAAYLHHLVGVRGLARLRPRTKTQQAAAGAAVVAAVVAIGLIANAAIGGGGNAPKLGAPAPSVTASPTTTSAPASTTSIARVVTTNRSTTTAASTTTAVPITASAAIIPTATSEATTTTTSEAATTTVAATTTSPSFATTTAVTLAPTRPSFATTTAVTLAPTVATVPPPPKPIADLSVSGSLLGPLVNGHNVYLSAVVANAGPAAADGVAVTMTLPAQLRFEAPASPSWTCALAADHVTLTCKLAESFANGAKTTLLVRANVSPPVVLLAQSENSAARGITAAALPPVTMEVSSNATDPSSTSDTSTVVLPAPTDGGMSALYATVDRGNITMTGASLMTCDVTDPACATALADKPSVSSPNATLDNGSLPMTAIDTDADAGTTASSSADLTIPDGGKVKQAYLVWGATAFDGTDTLVPDEFMEAQLTRTLPARAPLVVTCKPATCDRSTTRSQFGAIDAVYTRADVTEEIQAAGSGTYVFGSRGGYTGSGTNRAGGWALIVVYTDTTESLRSLVVLDGLVGYGSNANKTLTMSLGGLGPVAASTEVPVRFGVVGLDGDRGLPDTMTIGSAAPDLVPVADSNNPAKDVMNSTVSIRGSLQGDPNTMGFDADLVDLNLIGGGNLELTATGTDDQIRLGAITLSAPAS